MAKLQYTYSQLSSNTISQLISENYNLSKISLHQFYVLGLHDNYLIKCEQKKYIFRLYRNDWRSSDEINFELELLKYLDDNGGQVAAPIQTNKNGLSLVVKCPEGERSGALFHYADGIAPGNSITIEQSRLLGKSVAQIHKISSTFKSSEARQALDLSHLLDESVKVISPFVEDSSLQYLVSLKDRIYDSIPSVPDESVQNIVCIGDVNPTNFHINENNEITLFDFDQCGYGLRAFEIGKYYSSLHALNRKDLLSKAFVDGYTQHLQLSEEELESIPYYEMIAVIWVMAIHVYNVNRIGYKHLEKPFWDRKIIELKGLEARLL